MQDEPQLHPLELIDRERVLALLTPAPRERLGIVRSAAAAASPSSTRHLAERLSTEALPDAPGDPEALADGRRSSVLDARRLAPCATALYTRLHRLGDRSRRPACMAGALGNAYDVNLAAAAGAAEMLENQTIRWVAEFVGYPVADGAFTSGGMTSNLTALMAAREHALPGGPLRGRVSGRAAAAVLLRGVAPLGRPRGRGP